MVLLSIFFESDPRRDHQQIVLYSFVAPCISSHLAVKILLQIFLWRFEHVSLTYICRLYFPPECQQDRTLLQPILLSENILIFWHKSSTKHKGGSDQIETMKTIMQTTRPRITWVLPMAQVAIFKEIFDQVRKDLDLELFYSELKRHNVSHIFTI